MKSSWTALEQFKALKDEQQQINLAQKQEREMRNAMRKGKGERVVVLVTAFEDNKILAVDAMVEKDNQHYRIELKTHDNQTVDIKERYGNPNDFNYFEPGAVISVYGVPVPGQEDMDVKDMVAQKVTTFSHYSPERMSSLKNSGELPKSHLSSFSKVQATLSFKEKRKLPGGRHIPESEVISTLRTNEAKVITPKTPEDLRQAILEIMRQNERPNVTGTVSLRVVAQDANGEVATMSLGRIVQNDSAQDVRLPDGSMGQQFVKRTPEEAFEKALQNPKNALLSVVMERIGKGQQFVFEAIPGSELRTGIFLKQRRFDANGRMKRPFTFAMGKDDGSIQYGHNEFVAREVNGTFQKLFLDKENARRVEVAPGKDIGLLPVVADGQQVFIKEQVKDNNGGVHEKQSALFYHFGRFTNEKGQQLPQHLFSDFVLAGVNSDNELFKRFNLNSPVLNREAQNADKVKKLFNVHNKEEGIIEERYLPLALKIMFMERDNTPFVAEYVIPSAKPNLKLDQVNTVNYIVTPPEKEELMVKEAAQAQTETVSPSKTEAPSSQGTENEASQPITPEVQTYQDPGEPESEFAGSLEDIADFDVEPDEDWGAEFDDDFEALAGSLSHAKMG